MICKMCKERGKDWEGSDPICYFEDPVQNWNCATINAIRDIFAPEGGWVEPEDLPKGVCITRSTDMTYGLICITNTGGEEGITGCLYVQWYKRRGATEALWLVQENEPRRPTERELLAIIQYFRKKS